MDKNLSYEEALSEIQEILQNMEEGKITIDEVATKVKRAGFLLEYCQKKLRALENDLDQLLETED